MNRSLRIALWVGVACVALGAIAARQGLAVPSVTPPPVPTLVSQDALHTSALSGRVFEPLLTYSVVAAGASANASTPPSPPPDLRLCTTLIYPGAPPVAVFSLGNGFPIKFRGEKVGGIMVSAIGDGFVRLENGTMLMPTLCGQAAAGQSTTIQEFPSSGTGPIPQEGTYLPVPTPAPAATSTPYTPSMYGKPLPAQAPMPIPLYPGQTPVPTSIISPGPR